MLTVSFTLSTIASQDLWVSDAEHKAAQLNKKWCWSNNINFRKNNTTPFQNKGYTHENLFTYSQH